MTLNTLIPTAQTFYRQLASNNTRDWWMAHKDTYDDVLKPAACSLLDTLAPQIADLTGYAATPKLFRPHRDVRFSKDKTPYKPHLHMMWTLQTEALQNPVFFFGIGQDYVTTGAGLMGLDKALLTDWRKMLDLDTDRMLGVFNGLLDAGYRFREPALKRVPPLYDAGHPAADYLRMKGVVATRDMSDAANLPDDIMAGLRDVWPLNDLIISVGSP